MRMRLLVMPIMVLLIVSSVAMVAQADEADTVVKDLLAKVKGFSVIDLPASGQVVVKPDQALTIDRLRGVQIDDHPPVLRPPAKPYPANMADNNPYGQRPYVANGIAPFRFRYFNCEFNYGGWHTWDMSDYASAHGFNILSAYNRRPKDVTNVPAGTKWLLWGGFVNWNKWLPKHGIPAGRYDKLADLDVTKMLVQEKVFKPRPDFQQLMIDMEHGRLSPEALRKQDWYPKTGSAAQRQAFETAYYNGYAKTYVGTIEAARQAGFKDISVYGWQPFTRTYFGIDKVHLDPLTDWAWNAFGKQIYDAVDILNPSVYCFYWTPQNVAYTLANIDLNMRLVNSTPHPKPVRPYYWTLLHGGGGGWRWWATQPIRDEDVRAMAAMCFFTGCDGLDLWNWSGTGSHIAPPVLKPQADVMVGSPFSAKAEGAAPGAAPVAFARYDVLHVTKVADGTVTCQRIEKGDARGNYGVGEGKPTYVLPVTELRPHLRPAAEPVSAFIEGLALVKPFEYLLRYGQVKIDVSAQKQFAETLPIVRRVKMGSYNVVITYDPAWATEKGPRQIVLRDFDGHRGLTVTLPADAQTRIFLLRL